MIDFKHLKSQMHIQDILFLNEIANGVRVTLMVIYDGELQQNIGHPALLLFPLSVQSPTAERANSFLSHSSQINLYLKKIFKQLQYLTTQPPCLS